MKILCEYFVQCILYCVELGGRLRFSIRKIASLPPAGGAPAFTVQALEEEEEEVEEVEGEKAGR